MKFTISEKRTIERCFTMIKKNFQYLSNDEFDLNEDLCNLKNIRNKMVSVNKKN